jgi:predicted outer membrane repeat protein
LTVIDCTISGNASAGDAGGIAMNYGSLSITNSTITGNSAPGQGGGIYGRGTITITDTTISENTGGSAGGMYVGAGSGVAYNCTVDGSIIAANIGGDFGTYGKAVLSGASDLIGDGSDNGAFANSLRGTSGTPLNAKLAPLATNGGPTETIALLAGSPAIGTGAIFNGITTDQRGDSRPTAGGSDIGAYQVSTLIVNTLGDPATPMLGFLSLREAIAAANSSGGTEEIAFAPGLTGTINLASTLPAFTANIAIDGPGANVLTVNGNSHGSVFSINQSVTAEIEGLTITGGTGTPANGSNYGGGIHNLGNLTLTNSTITGNTATGSFGDGGGIYSSGFASQLSITDSTLSGNTSGQYGGAISLNYGTLTVSDSTITGNISHAGAGFFGRGSESFFDDTISGNLANLTGGVYVELGTLGTFSCTVDGTIIANNFGGDFANTSHTAATGSNDLIGDGSDNGVFTSSLRGTSGSPLSPKLASLAFNGGPTETMALQSGSPAIGTGAAFDAITTDQRGAPRPSGAGIDIGAYQVLVVNTLTDPVNQTSGILSLREAIVAANSLGGSQEITFLPGLTGTIALASVLPSITANVQIDGPGVSILTVNGENLGSVFTINPSAAVEINDLTITGGGMTDNGSLTTEGNVVTGAITGGGGLTVGAGLAAKLTLSMGAGPSAVTSLTLNTNATLNITNNSLIINYGTNPDPVTAVATALGTGYAGGAWTGAGIDSSTAASGSPGQTLSVGYDDGKTDIGAAVIGQLVLKYTLAGDYNLDGLVNFNDLVTVVQNFNKAGTDWAHGNFLFGSSTNFNDLVAVVQNFNKILTPAASTAQQSGGMIIPLAQAAAPPTPKKPAPVVSSNNYLAVPAAAQPASANEADENVLRSSSDDGSILES